MKRRDGGTNGLYKNVVIFDAALWEIDIFTNLFSKSQK